MVLEHIIVDIKEGRERDYEEAMATVLPRFKQEVPGLISFELRRCVETPRRYLVLAEWRSIDDHLVGFRESAVYKDYRALVAGCFDPPLIEHFEEPLAKI